MAIYRKLQNLQLAPDEACDLAAAYELTLVALDLKERDDPITRLVAEKILEIGQRGVRDVQQISIIATRELGN